MVAAWNAAVRWTRRTSLAAADRAGEATRALPGAVGALMVSWGLGQVYQPLFWITLGLFALAVDRRMT